MEASDDKVDYAIEVKSQIVERTLEVHRVVLEEFYPMHEKSGKNAMEWQAHASWCLGQT